MDWAKIATLLDVVHKAATAGPEFGWIAARARVELGKYRSQVPVPPPVEPPPANDPTYRETQLDLALKGKL